MIAQVVFSYEQKIVFKLAQEVLKPNTREEEKERKTKTITNW